ncbi:carboxynorspermidine decarboxylase [Candidatus Desulfovibrio trichonymphae]|uniref:Carboxynorspermidine/carboxyspermidine decarboxylase n=1 Tax=Candidatus Desulfovibrio trichonymphae TaxID=1725232 RepID=A0A1J1E3X3_9BACT|nr:carboxynorspermidine decarboxylase [Candidatus Desulfovibrio trichonymphae]BAV92152.1 carboxynorspermidine/carboxyspermidine decarboxylase [Candidatus Desulfovibrio trichonymphae]GHU92091.1 carboxynorspermidine/carboxyspermidine decarboxylase [Deltaproteobacteria bacterium]GHU99847.1 carboxynorspermidine/carboxyspermidine decarboxylase [Deltaproteobacteria bacterium]
MLCPRLLFDKNLVPAPCFVLDASRLAANAAVLDTVQRRTGAKILLALKAFAAFAAFPLLSRFAGNGPLWGVCASSVDEARLGREEFGGEVHAFAAAWTDEEIAELLHLADYIVFNSAAQWRRFRPMITAGNIGRSQPIACGLRINPEHSEVTTPRYDPCAPSSRLGIRLRHFDPAALDGISGLHLHTLCELDANALARTLAATEAKFSTWLSACAWINLGGGHHITRLGYNLDLLCDSLITWRERYHAQIYLEPGEAVALNAGWLAATVLDVVEADMPVAVLNISAACHTPDVLEMPYRPEALYEAADGIVRAGAAGETAFTCRLAGKSCLACDVFGEYAFAAPLQIGQRLVFEDMAIYSMVKTTTFNGLRLPFVGMCEEDATQGLRFRLLRTFGYEDFKSRLS